MQKTLNDLSTPNETTMQGEVSSKYGYPGDSELEEHLDLLLDKPKRHTNAQKRELMEKVIDQLYFHHSLYKLMTYEECHRHSSFLPRSLFTILDVGALPYNLLLRTPKDVRDLPDLRKKFKANNVNAMASLLKTKLCCWPGDFVQTAMMLLSHTFHHQDVRVFS